MHLPRVNSVTLIIGTVPVVVRLVIMTINNTTVQALSSVSTTRPFPIPIGAILFDIDGTLVNSDPHHFQVFQELRLPQPGFNNDRPIDESFFRRYISGKGQCPNYGRLFPDWSLEQRRAGSEG